MGFLEVAIQSCLDWARVCLSAVFVLALSWEDQAPPLICEEALEMISARGLSSFDALVACGDAKVGLDDMAGATDDFARALDEAALIYRDQCPPKLLPYYLEAKRVAHLVNRIEVLLNTAGRSQEAQAYRAMFSLQ